MSINNKTNISSKSRRLKKVLFLLMILGFLFGNASAQDVSDEPKYAGLCIATTPQLLLFQTVKLDFDLQLGNSKNWLMLSGLYTYRSDDQYWDYDFIEMYTVGGVLSYRFYPFCAAEPKWFYLQPGLVFNYSNVTYAYNDWGLTYFNGSEATRYMYKKGEDLIYQYGVDFKIGVMVKVNKRIFFDFYSGFGIRDAEVVNSDPNRTNHGDGILGPAYEGIMPLFGVRFGLHL